jgi:peptidoglycan/xylan/chitin deacetylase (PgdA/CDA1 family)
MRMNRVTALTCLVVFLSLATQVSNDSFAVEKASGPVLARAHTMSFEWRGIDPEPLRHKGSVSFHFETSARGRSVHLSYAISDSDGDVIARAEGISRQTGRSTIIWNAQYDDGSPVLPGLYRVRITVTDRAGHSLTGSAKPFRVLTPSSSDVIRSVEHAGNRVALTFDDCYKQDAWSRILRILSANHIEATFFCPGTQVARYPKLARRTVAEGNAIGSHGWDHRNTTHLSYRAIRTRLLKDEAVWWKVARNTPAPYFRPPYGAYDAKTLRAAGDTGYARVILWDVDPHDARRPGAAVIAHRVLSSVRRGSIVEMNVLGQTAGALPAILDGLRKEHLRPVTLPVLFEGGGFH